MAEALPLIAQAVGTVIGGPVVGTIAAIVTSMAVASYKRDKARQEARDAYNASLQDRNLTIRSGVAARRYALGRVRIGGATVPYADTVGENERMLDQVVACCEGPISAIPQMYFDDEWCISFSGGAPLTGKFASSNRKARAGNEMRTLSSSSTFTLSHAPRSAADVTVTYTAPGSDLSSVQLTVSSVSGTTVTLSEPFTGEVSVDYTYLDAKPPLQVQWLKGRKDQAATSWSGVTTDNWGAEDRLRGIVGFRTLMDWNEDVYASGPPDCSLVVEGVMPYDPRRNRISNADAAGASAGAPGVAPTGWVFVVGAGLSREIVGTGTDDITGHPYIDIRISGTAAAAGTVVVQPMADTAVTASSGQVWGARLGVRRLAGMAWTSWGLPRLVIRARDGSGDQVGATFVNAAAVDGMPEPVETTLTMPAGTAKVVQGLNLNHTAGQVVDSTFRLTLPQLWQGAVGAATDPQAWSSNPALLAGWYATLPRRVGGCGIPWSWIDWGSIVTAANICDELIAVRPLTGGSLTDIKRYECHTVLSTEASPLDNLDLILSAMAGSRAFTAGQYRFFAGAHRAPTFTITDRDVDQARPIRFEPSSGGAETPPNVMNGRIVDAAKNWVESGVSPVVNEAYVALDGGEEPDEMNLAATTDARQANYLMGVELENRRPGFNCQLTITGKGANVAIGDACYVDLEHYGDFASLTWEVVKRSNNFDGTYTLMLSQTKAWRWTLDADRFTPIDAPAPRDLSYLWSVAAVPGFDVFVAAPTVLPDGATVMRLVCVWDPHPQDYVRQSGYIELRYREVNATQWATVPNVPADQASTIISVAGRDRQRYVVQARAVNGLGASSEWAMVTDVDVTSAFSTGKTWVQAGDPGSAARNGDQWFETDNGNYHWVRVSGAWVSVQDGDVTAALAAAAAAQSTADGKIKSYYQPSPPTGASLGDLWFDTDNARTPYRWSGSAWVLAKDSDIAQALDDAAAAQAAAELAQATADGKIETYYQTSAPSGASVGDLWFDTDSDRKAYRWSGSAWVAVDDARIVAALADAAAAQETADGKIRTYFQTSPPSGASVGDLWFDTDDGSKQYRWSGSDWVLSADTRIGQAIVDAASAQATADGKVTTFFSSTTPTAEAVGDLWFKTTDQRMYRWSGSAWVLQSTVGAGDIDTNELAPGSATVVATLDDSTVTEHDDFGFISYTAPVACDVLVTVRSLASSVSAAVVDTNPRLRYGVIVTNSAGTTTLLDSSEVMRHAVLAGTEGIVRVIDRAQFAMTAGQTARFGMRFYGDFAPDEPNWESSDSNTTIEVIKR